MDLVVRTSHGEAEITLRLDGGSRTVGDVVERVTGRTAPTIVYVDGRAVPATSPLDTIELLVGSVISTDDETESTPRHAVAELAQIAGTGAGATAPLSPGRHVIGPGRRVSTDELGQAPVDEPVFEIDVGDEGTAVLTARRAGRLDGEPLEVGRAIPWRDEFLDVDGRVFRLGRPDPEAPRRGLGRGDRNGTVVFNRPPRPPATPDPSPGDVAGGNGPLTVRRWFRRSVPPRDLAAAVRAQVAEDRDHRRATQPDPVDALRRARRTDRRLWERRAGDDDAFQVPVGLADVAWQHRHAPASSGALPVTDASRTPPMTATVPMVPMVPMVVDLSQERCVAITGRTDVTAAMARSLIVSMATTHGPADLRIAVLTGPERAHAWEWVKWLPHARIGGPPRLLLTPTDVAGWVAAIRTATREPSVHQHLTLVVVDEPGWWRERTAPLRPLLAEASLPLRFVLLASSADDVPSTCSTIVSEQPDDLVTVDRPGERRRTENVRPYMVTPGAALGAARSLAPLDDPERPMPPVSPLPTDVRLLDLLEMPQPTAPAIAERWTAPGSSPTARIGATEAGHLSVDLLDDGPHVLVAGAPGQGRRGLLRTVVASLATGSPPDEVGFVLVGDGFEQLAPLPHTMARIGELHAHGIARLLRCLHAELRHREEILHDGDVVARRGVNEHVALPRLVVVVGELEALIAELPESASALVDLALRGPGLGVHLIVATRWPAGTVDDRLAARAGTRLTLRQQEEGDSVAMIGSGDATLLPEHVPGRGLARLGTGELIEFQSAGCVDDVRDAIDLRPFVVGRDLLPMEQRLERAPERSGHDGSGTDRLVSAIVDATDRLGRTPDRRPIPDPLPDRLPMREFFDAHPGDGVPFGQTDLPDEQRTAPAWWSPLGPVGSGSAGSARSNLLVFGSDGSGASSLLRTLLLGVAERFSPDDVHVHCLDTDGGGLAPLAALPHSGAVVGRDDVERIGRLLDRLSNELARRASVAEQLGDSAPVLAREPAIVLAIHDLGSLHAALDGRPDLAAAWPRLEEIVRDGPSVGIVVLATARHERDVPPGLAPAMPDRLVFELGDRAAYAAFGLRPADVPEFVPGRAIRLHDRVELQVAEPPSPLEAAVAAVDSEPALERPPMRVDPLPERISVNELAPLAEAMEDGVGVPVGFDTRSGDPALLRFRFGEHVVVTGPAGSGRSSVLVAVATALGNVAPDVALFAAALRGGPVDRIGGGDRSHIDTASRLADVGGWVQRIVDTPGPRVVLVDDADLLDGPGLQPLVSLRDGDVSLVVAGSNDDLRRSDHWSRPARPFRRAVLLAPASDDGELLGVSLGEHVSYSGAHTGFLVDDGTVVALRAVVMGPDARAEPAR